MKKSESKIWDYLGQPGLPIRKSILYNKIKGSLRLSKVVRGSLGCPTFFLVVLKITFNTLKNREVVPVVRGSP